MVYVVGNRLTTRIQQLNYYELCGEPISVNRWYVRDNQLICIYELYTLNCNLNQKNQLRHELSFFKRLVHL